MTRNEARQRRCDNPRCKAAPGDLCRRPNGKRTQAVHWERWPASEFIEPAR